MKWAKFITCGLILWALIILGLFASIRWAGAHQFAVTHETRCLADGSTWVEWSFENDTPRAFTITESTPPLPPEIGPATTITAIDVLPPGWTGTVYADIRGYWAQPDDTRLWWSDGASLTIEENQCGSTPTTAPTTTTLPPVEKVQVTSTTTGGTPTAPDFTPTTVTHITITGQTAVSPTTTTTQESTAEVGNITAQQTTTPTLADTGAQTGAIIFVALVALTCGVAMVLTGRRKP